MWRPRSQRGFHSGRVEIAQRKKYFPVFSTEWNPPYTTWWLRRKPNFLKTKINYGRMWITIFYLFQNQMSRRGEEVFHYCAHCTSACALHWIKYQQPCTVRNDSEWGSINQSIKWPPFLLRLSRFYLILYPVPKTCNAIRNLSMSWIFFFFFITKFPVLSLFPHRFQAWFKL